MTNSRTAISHNDKQTLNGDLGIFRRCLDRQPGRNLHLVCAFVLAGTISCGLAVAQSASAPGPASNGVAARAAGDPATSSKRAESGIGGLPVDQSSRLALKPPMGWNGWKHWEDAVTDAIVRQQVDALASNGMKAAGYEYVNLDDGWEGQRDAQGNIHPNQKFPDMKALADYVHSKGLKFGIYSTPGPKTCKGYEGGQGHEDQDAKTFASWGVDYFKYDWCSGSGDMKQAYKDMYDALRRTGRPMVYSLCQYGLQEVWTWGAEVGGNLWCTAGDTDDTYSSMSIIGFGEVGWERFAGPGHWNDPDMLQIGNGGMNEDEYRTHMSLWSIEASPLIAGNDLTKVTPSSLAILTNPEVIAVDQDAAGIQGRRVRADGQLELWTKPLADGRQVVGMFNRGDSSAPMTLHFSDIGVHGSADLRNLWTHADLGTFTGSFTATVPKHGVVLLAVKTQ